MQHHIIVKWNSKVEDKRALCPKIEALFQKTLAISGIHKIEVIPNIIDRPNRYDLMIRMTMEEEALPIYDASPWHAEWKERYGSLMESKAIFDCA